MGRAPARAARRHRPRVVGEHGADAPLELPRPVDVVLDGGVEVGRGRLGRAHRHGHRDQDQVGLGRRSAARRLLRGRHRGCRRHGRRRGRGARAAQGRGEREAEIGEGATVHRGFLLHGARGMRVASAQLLWRKPLKKARRSYLSVPVPLAML